MRLYKYRRVCVCVSVSPGTSKILTSKTHDQPPHGCQPASRFLPSFDPKDRDPSGHLSGGVFGPNLGQGKDPMTSTSLEEGFPSILHYMHLGVIFWSRTKTHDRSVVFGMVFLRTCVFFDGGVVWPCLAMGWRLSQNSDMFDRDWGRPSSSGYNTPGFCATHPGPDFVEQDSGVQNADPSSRSSKATTGHDWHPGPGRPTERKRKSLLDPTRMNRTSALIDPHDAVAQSIKKQSIGSLRGSTSPSNRFLLYQDLSQ